MTQKENKYKVKDAAKDLNMSAGDIVDMVKELAGTERKPAGSLTESELNLVLEKVSQSNQVKDFEAYFAATEKKAAEPEKKEAPKAEKKTAPKAEVKAEPKAEPKAEEKQAPKAEPKEEPKAEPKAEKPVEKKAEAPKQEEKKPFDKNKQDRPQRNDRPAQNDRFEKRQNGDRPQQGGKFDKNGDKPKFDKNNNNKFGDRDRRNDRNDRPQQDKKPVQQPVKQEIKIDINAVKTNEPPKAKVKGEAVKRGEQVTKYVDTRGSYVDLDKYNERYETIAPQGRNGRSHDEGFTKKQKINQKSQNKKPFGSKNNRETEAQKLKRLELERARKQQLKVLIPDEIVVSELAQRLKVTASEVIKKLMLLGEMCTINQTIDFDTASLVAEELGAKVEKEVVVTIEERLFEEIEDTEENLQPRSPVVVVMGHVDHGKTSLLDRIRNASVASGEAGGITQHIGAYKVNAGGKDITFLDTPGHEAFTSMRARGASITDIAIIVVAADDGIMPQTVEAINHAKAAEVSIIVAINKMDKPTANPDRVKQELTEHGLVVEEWGGDVICVPVSAKTGEGIDDLLEMVNLSAEVLELKANPDRLAQGTVIEAKLDKGRGPVATMLVQKGTLKQGDIIIAGTSVGRVRVMRNDRGRTVKEAGPSTPVEIMGLGEVPSAGDSFAVVENEKLARELVEKRKFDAKEEQFKLYQKVTLDNLFSQIEEGEMKTLPLIVKADVQGSVEAVRQSLEKLSNEEVRVRVIHGAVGAISESDVMLASASNAIIIGFNVRPHPAAAENAKRDGVDVRLYRIIYDAIEEVQTAIKGMLAPKFREVDLARVEVRQVYKITNVGIVAGCYVLSGKVERKCNIRIVRDGIIVGDDKIDGLRRFKDDVKEVAEGYECGISLEKFTDIKEGDIFEAYMVEEYRD
ncbi:MAG: translation initiation factor IF-2 [Ruminiclostridium sp.]|nr:translation initiation factor IF-2 [Ruminiclostridium sp.]